MVGFADALLAQYRVTYQPDQRRLKTVADSHLFETPRRARGTVCVPLPPGRRVASVTLRRAGHRPIVRNAQLLMKRMAAHA